MAGAGCGSPGLAAPWGWKAGRDDARAVEAAASPPPPPAGPSSGGAIAGTASSRGPVPPWLPAVPANGPAAVGAAAVFRGRRVGKFSGRRQRSLQGSVAVSGGAQRQRARRRFYAY